MKCASCIEKEVLRKGRATPDMQIDRVSRALMDFTYSLQIGHLIANHPCTCGKEAEKGADNA